MNEEERFFYHNAGFSWSRDRETKEEGRIRTAKMLAAAEQRLLDGPYYISWQPDDRPWDGDIPYDGPLWVVTLWTVEGMASPQILGSLGGVACEEHDSYFRVVAAELAAEHIPA